MQLIMRWRFVLSLVVMFVVTNSAFAYLTREDAQAFEACRLGSIALLSNSLNNGARLQVINPYGKGATLLHTACRKDVSPVFIVDLIQLAQQQGKEYWLLTRCNDEGQTALDYCCAQGLYGLATAILNAVSGDIRRRLLLSLNPLICAVSSLNSSLVLYLLRQINVIVDDLEETLQDDRITELLDILDEKIEKLEQCTYAREMRIFQDYKIIYGLLAGDIQVTPVVVPVPPVMHFNLHVVLPGAGDPAPAAAAA